MNAAEIAWRTLGATGLLLACAAAARAQPDEPPVLRLAGSTGAVTSVQIADERQVLTAVMDDGTIRRWRLTDGAESLSVPVPPAWTHGVTLVAGGRVALGAGADGVVQTLRVVPGAEPAAGLAAPEGGPFTRLTFVTSQGGDHVAVRYVKEPPERRGTWIDRGRIAAVSADGKPSLVREIGDWPLELRFGADGCESLVRFGVQQVTTERVADGAGRERVAAIRAPGDLFAGTISSDGRWVAFLDRNTNAVVHAGPARARYLDSALDSGPPTGRPTPPFAAGPATFVPQRAVLVVGDSRFARVRLWNVMTGAVIHDLPVEPGFEVRVDVSPAGTYLAASSGSGITVWTLDPEKLPALPPPTVDAEPVRAEGPASDTVRLGASPWRYGGRVHGLALSPDGATLYSSDDSGTLEARRAEDMGRVWKSRLEGGVAKELLVTPDGKTLVAARSSARVAVIDAATGKLVDEIPHGNELGGMFHNAHTIALDPAGRRVALGGVEGTVVWNLEAGQGEMFFPGWKADLGLGIEQPTWPVGLLFGPGKETLASYCIDGRARTYDLGSGRTEDQVVARGVRVHVTASADGGKTVVFGTDTGAVLARTGSRERSLGTGFGRALDPGQEFLPGTPRDRVVVRPGAAEVWRTGRAGIVRSDFSGGETQTLPEAHGGQVCALTFSADGRTAYSGSVDGTVCRWDAEAGSPGPRPSGHLGIVSAIDYAPDGKTVAAAGWGDGILIWPTAGGAPKRTIPTGRRFVRALAHSRNGAALAVVSRGMDAQGRPAADSLLQVWDLARGRERLSHELEVNDATCVALDAKGQRTIVGTDSGLMVITARGAVSVNVAASDASATVVAVEFAPDGKFAVAATKDRVVLLDVGKRTVSRAFERAPQERSASPPSAGWRVRPWSDVAFDAGGRRVIALEGNGRAFVWDRDTGKLQRAGTSACGRVWSSALAADGSRAALLSKAGALVVRGVGDDALAVSLPALRVRQDRHVFALAPDGSSLCTTESDGTLLIRKLGQ